MLVEVNIELYKKKLYLHFSEQEKTNKASKALVLFPFLANRKKMNKNHKTALRISLIPKLINRVEKER